MNKFLRFAFILLIVAMLGAAVIQIFQPQLLGSDSAYGLSVYWQREIDFWNLALLPLLIGVLIKYDWFYLRLVLLALILGGLGFGTNHLLGYLQLPNNANLLGCLENYFLVLLRLLGWYLESQKRNKSDEARS